MPLKHVHPQKRAWYVRCGGEQSMIPQHQEIVLTQVFEQALALVHPEHDALVIMITDTVHQQRRRLADRKQPFFLCGYRQTVASMGMKHTGHNGARFMDRAVDVVTGHVYPATGGIINDGTALFDYNSI